MTTRELEFSSPPQTVDAVHELLDRLWADTPEVAIADRFRFETALIELASNVIRHADDGSGVTCMLRVEVTPSSLAASLVDTGRVGDIDLEQAMPDGLEESGRGIPLIRALVDHVEYTRVDGRNRWEIQRGLSTE